MKKMINFLTLTLLLLTLTLFTSASFVQAQTELPLTATASGSYWGTTPNNAVDGNLNTYWQGQYTWWGGSWWLMLNCGNTYNLSSISIWWHRDYGATNYDIETSVDGTMWDKQYSGLSSAGGSTNPRLVSYDLSGIASGVAQFVLIKINQAQSWSPPTIYEVKIYRGVAPNQLPTAQASANPTSGAAPLQVQFTGSGTDPDGTIVGYSWNFGDGVVSGAQNPTHTYQNPGTYTATLTVTDDDGAKGSDSVTITVTAPANQPPTAQASANPTSGTAPLQVQFTGSGTDPDGTIASYRWAFGDGGSSTQQNPTHTYQNPGVYTATLTVTDDDGATDSAEVVITVQAAGVPSWKIPQLLRFQGRITDNNGVALNGAYKLTFRIYDAATGGNRKWQEIQNSVPVSQGVFSVLLGSVAPLDLDFAGDYWLSIEIENNGEMTPRQRITSVGYAYRAEAVNKGAMTYTGSGEVSPNLMETVYLHLEAEPKSIKLYLWGEQSNEGGYPNGVNVYLDGVDKTDSLLALANLNWGGSESAFGNGTSSHPLVAGAAGVSGTGALELSGLLNWTAGEHRINFIVTGLPEMPSGRLRYNFYIKY